MIHTVITEVHLPAGVAGPDPMDFDVRCFLLPHATGLTLVDTGLEHTVPSITAQLTAIGATWGDVTDVILTHHHPDHTGGLPSVLELAPEAVVWAADTLSVAAQPAHDGQVIRGLRVVATPGHTPGHLSLLATDDDALLLGDLAGTQGDLLVRAPAAFTADAATAEDSLRKASRLDFATLIPSHGAPTTPEALRDLV